MHECELTNLSRTTVDAAALSSFVAERWRPAVVAVAVSVVVTNLQQNYKIGRIVIIIIITRLCQQPKT